MRDAHTGPFPRLSGLVSEGKLVHEKLWHKEVYRLNLVPARLAASPPVRKANVTD
jgi:hypothetical protein